ncbi:MAG: hypothetical protein O7D94_13610 [Planctomycetota bacterium]|nr:hypothetical protein [Planctomycetota bacterium]
MHAPAIILIGIVVPMMALSAAWADGNEAEFVLPVGLSPHVRPVKDGRIDWAEGFIFAEGQGKGSGRKRADQDRLMAKRAAELAAARNAILIADGIPVDADGRFKNVRTGEVRVGGQIKGHKTVSVVWRANADPPECVATVKVPLWGVKGVASVVHATQVNKIRRSRQRHLVLAGGDADVSDEILVIDARGLGAEPCLYPVVLGTDGGVLYDISTIVGGGQSIAPAVRYVETSMTYEALRASLSGNRDGVHPASPVDDAHLGFFGTFKSSPDRSAWNACDSMAVGSGGGSFGMPLVDNSPSTPTTRASSRPATSQPTAKPDKKSRRRRRRRAVKAVRASGQSKTEIVLTREDAERLRNDPRGANLLKKGQVYVVMDAAAAGIQGRLDRLPEAPALALLGPR